MGSTRGKSIFTLLAVLVFVSSFGGLPASARSDKGGLKEFVLQAADIYLTVIGNKGYDTTYIFHPEHKLMVTPRAIMNGFDIYNNNTSGKVEYDAFKSARLKLSLGADVDFRGLSAGYGYNPLKKQAGGRAYRDNFFTFNFFGNRFCIDALYEDDGSLEGDMRRDGVWMPLPEGVLSHKTLAVSGYYVFNNRRFSYPAAFTQSFVQKKSAGSVIGALSCTSSRFVINPWVELGGRSTEAGITTVGIGAGYGYNLVTPYDWTLHFSAIPTVGMFLSGSSSELFAGTMTGRVAVVKYFSGDRIFLSLTAHGEGLLALESFRFSYGQMLWEARFRLGFRF